MPRTMLAGNRDRPSDPTTKANYNWRTTARSALGVEQATYDDGSSGVSSDAVGAGKLIVGLAIAYIIINVI